MRYRYERKYFLNTRTAALIRGRVAAVMRPDAHSGGVYEVNNLYLDDVYDSFYNGKLTGAFSRDKYRVRFYNGDLSFIRLERKHKDGEMSYKESVQITGEQYAKIAEGDLGFTLEEQSSKLIGTLGVLHRLRRLRPSAAFTYTREAYVYAPGNVRITFDSRIGEDVQGFSGGAFAPPGAGGMLEVKYDAFLPDVIANLLDGLPLTRTDMSKYCYIREKEAWRHARQAIGFTAEHAASGKP